MAPAPRKIFRLPSMCPTTKATSTAPVTAMTTFLPTMVLHSATAGLLGHTVGERRAGARGAWSAAVPGIAVVIASPPSSRLLPTERRTKGSGNLSESSVPHPYLYLSPFDRRTVRRRDPQFVGTERE